MDTDTHLRIGIIGSGFVSRFVHIPGFQRCQGVEVAVVCDAARDVAESAAQAFGIAATTTDYRDVLQEPTIDAVVIATPNNLHYQMTLDALTAGKHVLCEKPLAMSLAEAEEMASAAARSGRVNLVSFVYRFVPAMRYLKSLVDGGHLGEIRHFRAQWLQCTPNKKYSWRSERRQSGSGVVGDEGSHLIDFARHLVGEITAVSAWCKTFVTRRIEAGTGCGKDSDSYDSGAFLAEFSSGATGVFEISRLVLGRGTFVNDRQYVEVNGTKGTAAYQLYEPFRLQVCLGEPFDERHLVTVPVPPRFHVWPGSPRSVLADAPGGGFRYDQPLVFVQAIRGVETAPLATFEDGLRCQAVLDAVLEAAENRRWVAVKQAST